MLDNLFATLGSVGTAAALCVILAFVGTPAIGAVVCPANPLRKLHPRGR